MEDVTEVDADNLSSGDAVTLISSAIAGLNADDIESFQILKTVLPPLSMEPGYGGGNRCYHKKGKAGSSKITYTENTQ